MCMEHELIFTVDVVMMIYNHKKFLILKEQPWWTVTKNVMDV